MALDEADYSMTAGAFVEQPRNSALQQGANWGPQPGDEALYVKFFKESIEDQVKTRETGRPIFKEVDFIEICQPGNRNTLARRPASDRDKARFPKHFEAYLSRVSQEDVEGTLLSEWPGVNRATVEELAYFNIKTVEQLARVSDANNLNFRNLQTLKREAKAYLAKTADSKAAKELADELNARDSEILILKKQVAELSEMVGALNKRIGTTETPPPLADPTGVSVMPAPVVETAPMISPDALILDPDEELEDTSEDASDTNVSEETPRRRRGRPRSIE